MRHAVGVHHHEACLILSINKLLAHCDSCIIYKDIDMLFPLGDLTSLLEALFRFTEIHLLDLHSRTFHALLLNSLHFLNISRSNYHFLSAKLYQSFSQGLSYAAGCTCDENSFACESGLSSLPKVELEGFIKDGCY
jgi:hypothetical protein